MTTPWLSASTTCATPAHIVGRCIVNGQPCVYVARKIGDRVRVDCLLESEVEL
jgi:hypothetical protein